MSFLSDDFEVSELINDELSDSMSFCCGEVRDNDDVAWGGILISERPVEESENKLRIDRIFTTGLPQSEADRYYSRHLLKIHPNQSS